MSFHCLKCRWKTESKNPKVTKTNKERMMHLSKYPVCDSEKSRIIKKQEVNRVLSTSLGLKILLSKTPLLGDILF